MGAGGRHVVIGGGIIGLAVADRLCREHPGAQVTLVEKEPAGRSTRPGATAG